MAETNPAYLSGVWDAMVSWAKGTKRARSLETKAKRASELVDRVLHLEKIAEKHNSRIKIILEEKDC